MQKRVPRTKFELRVRCRCSTVATMRRTWRIIPQLTVLVIVPEEFGPRIAD